MTYEEPHEYGRRIRNNAAKLIDAVTQDLGEDRPGVPHEIMAAVLIAKSNLAIAASLIEAATLRGNS